MSASIPNTTDITAVVSSSTSQYGLIGRATPYTSAPPRAKSASPWPWSSPGAVRLALDEQMLWQGGPTVISVLVRLYHVRIIAIYGALLTLADIVQAKLQGETLWPALETAIPGTMTTLGAIAILAALAWCSARTTRYSLTSQRLIMQCGVALPTTIGIPLTQIISIAVRVRADGTGDITLLPKPGSKLLFIKLWPFARPWHISRPEPMLRDIPSAGYVATVLSRKVAEALVRAEQEFSVMSAQEGQFAPVLGKYLSCSIRQSVRACP